MALYGTRRALLKGRRTYSEKVLSYAPIAYWPLWEATGTTAACLVNSAQNGTYTGVTLANGTAPDGSPAPFFDGANDYTDIDTASLVSAFNGGEGTLMVWAQVFDAGVWTDGTTRRGVYFIVDGNNYVSMFRSTVNNEFAWIYKAGGVTRARVRSAPDTDFVHCGISWSSASDEVRAYADGIQVGATLNGLGVWVGALGAAFIGAGSVAPIHVWHGWVAHCAVWDSALSPAAILDLAAV